MVASGTSAKQVASEAHLKRIGYDGMLLESLLALAVLLAVGSSLDFIDYKAIVYPVAAGVKSNPILAFSLSVGRLLEGVFAIPTAYGTVVGILLVEGFVITLDAAVRLNRYLFEELWEILFGKGGVPALLRHPWFNSGLSVAAMLALAWTNAFNTIWPIFGSANQLLAALSLIVVSAWLLKKGRGKFPLFTAIPAAAMLVTTVASLLLLLPRYWADQSWSLVAANLLLLVLTCGMVVYAGLTITRRKTAAQT
jgi:carbon starvation protein